MGRRQRRRQIRRRRRRQRRRRRSRQRRRRRSSRLRRRRSSRPRRRRGSRLRRSRGRRLRRRRGEGRSRPPPQQTACPRPLLRRDCTCGRTRPAWVGRIGADRALLRAPRWDGKDGELVSGRRRGSRLSRTNQRSADARLVCSARLARVYPGSLGSPRRWTTRIFSTEMRRRSQQPA